MPTTTPEHDKRIAEMTFSAVYPHYVTKVEKKGRSGEELHEVITWLTGFNDTHIQKMIDDKVTFETFFKKAKLNPNAKLIKGVQTHAGHDAHVDSYILRIGNFHSDLRDRRA